MNRINPRKLLQSKWTAVTPQNKEKHFLVTKVCCDAEDVPQTCIVEAVHSQRETEIDWRDLKDDTRWRIGWQ